MKPSLLFRCPIATTQYDSRLCDVSMFYHVSTLCHVSRLGPQAPAVTLVSER
jgi:hypothetical protein